MNTLPCPDRHLQAELMDQPELDEDRHIHALRGLGRINWISRSDAIFWPCLNDLLRTWTEGRPLRILDVAAGGCDVTLRLAARARKAGFSAEFSACDISPRALAFGAVRATEAGLELKTIQCDVLRNGVPIGYDVILNSLFLHHLKEEEAIAFLRDTASAAGVAFILQDLVRSPFGLLLARVAPRILTRSEVVHTDGLRSAQAAFSLREVGEMAAAAGLTQARFTKHWPERFRLEWRRP